MSAVETIACVAEARGDNKVGHAILLGGDLEARMGKAVEQHLIGQLVAHAAVEAVHVAVARIGMPLDANLAGPGQQGVGGQLYTIVAGDHARLAHLWRSAASVPAPPADRRTTCPTLPPTLFGHAVDHIEHPEAPA